MKAIEYKLPDGFRVLVGKTDADNDELSLKIARPDDWWFHVHALPGSHVILQAPEGVEADRPVLEVAAAIAAHHSKAKNAGRVPVSYTRARNVSKPRGAKDGTVVIRKEATLKVRPGLPAEAPRLVTL